MKALTAILVAIGLSVLALLWALRAPERPAPPVASLALSLLDASDARFARVEPEAPLAFPADHGPHPEQRTEWWSLHGYLEDASGRAFAFQLTLLRLALVPARPERPSRWGTSDVYRGLFALTDVAQQRFHVEEKLSRAALGLAGAERTPPRIWIDQWTLELAGGTARAPRFRLAARGAESRAQLELDARKAPLGAGGAPFADLGAGLPFRFYALTRLAARGRIAADNARFSVAGEAWLDRAWGEVPLPLGPVALDRLALRLDDGRELALFELRRRDGSGTPVRTGFVVDPRGQSRVLASDAFELAPSAYWTSPRGGARYPSAWRLRLPDERLTLEIRALIANQEVVSAVRYWSGAVTARGTAAGRAVQGHGHAELTDYAERVKT